MNPYRVIWIFLAVILFSGITHAADVRLETDKGNITLRLYEDKAPITTDNFLRYTAAGFYDNTIFHRVIKDFVIQGGGLGTDMAGKTTRSPIVNESSNGLSNKKYTIAMARSTSPDSATSQFYINTADNLYLDKKYAQDGWGYAVFGEVIEGKDVVDAINGVKTETVGGYKDVPVDQIIVSKATILNPASVCLYAGNDLNLNVPCVEYQGVRYGFGMNFSPVADDPVNLYWKMDASTFKNANNTEGSCIAVGNDLKLDIPCARYLGTAYQFSLNHTPVKNDLLYWKMDVSTFKAK